MTRLRRSFTAEFKLETASLVLDQGYSVPEASRSLNVGEAVFRSRPGQLSGTLQHQAATSGQDDERITPLQNAPKESEIDTEGSAL